MLHNVTSTSTRKAIRAKISPSVEERKELGITTSMTMTILNNLRTVVARHEAEFEAAN